MRQKFLAYLISILFLLVGALLTSGLLSGLYYYHILSTQVYEIMMVVVGVLLFLVAGGLLGRRITKKALLHALVFLVPVMLISMISSDIELVAILTNLGKSLAYCIGTIFGLNHHDKS